MAASVPAWRNRLNLAWWFSAHQKTRRDGESRWVRSRLRAWARPGVVSLVSLPAPSATGTAGGGALGAGAAVGLQLTFTTMEATYNLSNVPSGIAMTIAPLIPYIPLLFKTP